MNTNISNRRIIYTPALESGGGGGTDADASAWAAAVVTAGGTVSANQLAYVSTLITAYKAAGVWTLLDREWLYASENAFCAKVDIKGLASHTLVGSTLPAFTANRGYDSGAAGIGYIDTGYITGSNFLLNAHSFGGYVFTPRTSGVAGSVMGEHDTAYVLLQPNNNGTQAITAAADSTFQGFANTQAAGNYIVTRTSSTNVDFYKNPNAALSASATSVAVPALNWFALAFNSNGSADQFYPASEIVSSIFMGGVLNGTQAAAKNAALNTYMTAVGANVY
jgi:hypothetical protein